MRFGIFLAPFHVPGDNPTLALHDDLQLVAHLDRLGFDEAWIGEHHSAGTEIIASPEVFMATAAERTSRIRLGTGVSSLPYQHPLMLTDRMVLLDHLTRGRVMLGAGPGSLQSDAHMLGIESSRQREMMEESLEAIMLLLTSDEPVDYKTDWFTLQDAQLQLRPYTQPHFEVAVAAMVSPSGPRASGRFGTGLLSVGATQEEGFNALEFAWGICEERAREYGQSVDRDAWRLVGPMYLAETEEQARREVAHGLPGWMEYFRKVATLPLAPDAETTDEMVDALNDSGFAVIGTPDDAIRQIERLEQKSGGFGCFLNMATDWADRADTHNSYELFARYVMPRFQGSTESRLRSQDWAIENRALFMGQFANAINKAYQEHFDSTSEENSDGP